MKSSHALVAFLLSQLMLQNALADTPSPEAPAPVQNSSLTAELFYEVLMGELSLQVEDAGTAYAYMLDAARKTHDKRLYQRSVRIAIQAQAGDAALKAIQAWTHDLGVSPESQHELFQVLLGLNRIDETLGPLKSELAQFSGDQRQAFIAALPRAYAKASDKKMARRIIEQALLPYTQLPQTAAVAWGSIGRMRLFNAELGDALQAARQGILADPKAHSPALLALELFGLKQAGAEAVLLSHLQAQPGSTLRMGYVRVLLDARRIDDGMAELDKLTQERPDLPEAWLLQGSLLAEFGQAAAAEQALARYLVRTEGAGDAEALRGRNQSYLVLADLAQQRQDNGAALQWLARIDNTGASFNVQARRAVLLQRAGRLTQALELVRALPEDTPAQLRAKRLCEAQLLRDSRQYENAYKVLEATAQQTEPDVELLYEQALLAEKLGRLQTMEQLLERIITLQPDYYHAYNALGYSWAERNLRLPEARQMILKALEIAPGDPLITDSLGWVEFKMGRFDQALELLQQAYKNNPDAEIAAHLGEVLWAMGQQEQARAIWRQGLKHSADNESLKATLSRLNVKL